MDNERYVDVTVGAAAVRGRLWTDRSPVLGESLWSRLPIEGSMILDEWSGRIARMRCDDAASLRTGTEDQPIAFPFPGLVAWEPVSRDFALCVGQGRLQSGLGPLVTYPVVELAGDLAQLAHSVGRLQYDGAMPFRIDRSADPVAQLPGPVAESNEEITLRLGDVEAVAALTTASAPTAARSFACALPAYGIATNTVLSGPLVRFRFAEGEGDREFALATGPDDQRHMVLWPGYVYYRPIAPQGLRIALRDATVMAEIGTAGNPVIPVARILDPIDRLAAVADRLRFEGSTQIALTIRE